MIMHLVLFVCLAVSLLSAHANNISPIDLNFFYTRSIIPVIRSSAKATVSPDRTISGSYNWLRLGQGATDRQFFATIPSSGRIPRSISTRGRAITKEWRILMAIAIVGNRATIGSDQRLMYVQRSLVTAGDRWYDQSIVVSCARSYEQSWHTVTDRTSTCDIL